MIIWLILGVLGLIVLLFFKIEHKKKEITLILLVLILILIYFSSTNFFAQNDLKFDSPKDITNTISLYVTWLLNSGSVIQGILKDSFTTIGHVIKGNQTEER